ncbi:MAG: sigma 54-interacting transcriptional regulator [Myxococcales bacterium]|nr:sigma 54-interacting transcriptional regulator [Myxococcales bacterium]
MNIVPSRLQQLLTTICDVVDAFLAVVLVQIGGDKMQVITVAGPMAAPGLENAQLDLSVSGALAGALREASTQLIESALSQSLMPEAHDLLRDKETYTLVLPFQTAAKLRAAIVLESPKRVVLDAKLVRTLKSFTDIAATMIEDEATSYRPGAPATGKPRKTTWTSGERSAIIGESPVWRDVIEKVGLVAPTTTPVLIIGETGSGKEQVAKAIHEMSDRSHQPFVAVNCSVLVPELALSELFGHEKGAFTGADRRRLGRFELAEKGTIFLDEIGELPAVAQAQLLRVLQEWTFERVGGTEKISADVRLVAATHRNLVQLMEERLFRDDLYYRLNVFPIHVPPLRERLGDIPLLARYITDRLRMRFRSPDLGISEDAVDAMTHYHWPGNVRELCNVLERGAILSGGAEIKTNHLQLTIEPRGAETAVARGKPDADTAVPTGYLLPESLTRMERAMALEIFSALNDAGNRISGPKGAAALLGVPPSTLQSTIKRLGLRP